MTKVFTTSAFLSHFFAEVKSGRPQSKKKQLSPVFNSKIINVGYKLEHKTCDILAAERLRFMRFDN